MAIDEAGDTPILREYRAVKEQHPDAILLARLGDFFEMFGTDAEAAAPVLGVTLTGRRFGNAGRLPMCGVPYHAAPQYIRRLLGAGHRVALWDQVGEVESGRMVQRQVTRVLSAGTAVDAELLEPRAVTRCVALAVSGGVVGVAALDASTGELQLVEPSGGVGGAALGEELLRLECAEMILAEGTALGEALLPDVTRTVLPQSLFHPARAAERLRAAAGVQTLATIDAEDVPVAQCAAGALLAYCERGGLVMPPQLLRVRVLRSGTTMRLDAQTRRNLELLTPLGAGGASLVSVLDRTQTAGGSRLLRDWLQAPLLAPVDIARRADAVQALVTARDSRRQLRTALTEARDVERLAARAVRGSASPRDLAAVRDTCRALESVRSAVQDLDVAQISRAAAVCVPPGDLLEHLVSHLAEEPPAAAREGGAIRPGADQQLDELVAAGAGAREFISSLEQRERETTGIRSLRVGYNRVFGYYIEVPNSQKSLVPAHYVRKQTLAGGERFLTADLKEHEAIVVHARERSVAREREVLGALAQRVAAQVAALMRIGEALSSLDVLQSLAATADDEGWVRPAVDESAVVDIAGGRHPLVERALGRSRFVPNDCTLDAAERILVLTGPNMAGKSTYLRQVAVIALLAQVGSYVPADSARIGICDRIFTRIGAHDDLAGGMSTFMVEMAETAAILRQASVRSLVILDEIGRGTSTYDGLSIAQAVIEHIHDSPQLNCRTLFATHLHELTQLADSLARVRNARVEVEEQGDRVTFLHRIVPGGADRSYGIHVAKLAGVPSSVLTRARQLLHIMERSRPVAATTDPAESAQLTLALPSTSHPVLSELVQLDIDTLSPIAALNKLSELQQRVAP